MKSPSMSFHSSNRNLLTFLQEASENLIDLSDEDEEILSCMLHLMYGSYNHHDVPVVKLAALYAMTSRFSVHSGAAYISEQFPSSMKTWCASPTFATEFRCDLVKLVDIAFNDQVDEKNVVRKDVISAVFAYLRFHTIESIMAELKEASNVSGTFALELFLRLVDPSLMYMMTRLLREMQSLNEQ
jgi:hypothetical protein